MTTRFIIKNYGYDISELTYEENFNTKEEAIAFAKSIDNEYYKTSKEIIERTIDEKTFTVIERKIGIYDKFKDVFFDIEEEYRRFKRRV